MTELELREIDLGAHEVYGTRWLGNDFDLPEPLAGAIKVLVGHHLKRVQSGATLVVGITVEGRGRIQP